MSWYCAYKNKTVSLVEEACGICGMEKPEVFYGHWYGNKLKRWCSDCYNDRFNQVKKLFFEKINEYKNSINYPLIFTGRSLKNSKGSDIMYAGIMDRYVYQYLNYKRYPEDFDLQTIITDIDNEIIVSDSTPGTAKLNVNIKYGKHFYRISNGPYFIFTDFKEAVENLVARMFAPTVITNKVRKRLSSEDIKYLQYKMITHDDSIFLYQQEDK